MTNPVPDGLPVWVQALIYIGTVAGSVFAAAMGWKRKQTPTSDANNVLIAGDIMDTRPMKDLAAAVERVCDGQERVLTALGHVEAAVERQTKVIERGQR